MNNYEILQSLIDFFARSRSFDVWFEEHCQDSVVFTTLSGSYIYLINENGHFSVSIRNEYMVVINLRNLIVEEFHLSDPLLFERLIKWFDIDEQREPAIIDPIKAMAHLVKI